MAHVFGKNHQVQLPHRVQYSLQNIMDRQLQPQVKVIFSLLFSLPLLAATTLSACAGEKSGTAPAFPLRSLAEACDATDRVVFAWSTTVPFEMGVAGSAVEYELGSPFVYVDGHCRYWVNDCTGALWGGGPIRSAALEGSARQDLDTWMAGAGEALRKCNGSTEVHDQTPALIFNGDVARVCYLSGSAAQIAVDFQAIVERLCSEGEDLTGAVRLTATPALAPPGTPEAIWPLQEPITDFVLADDQMFSPGVSHKVTDPSDCSKLRALRTEYVQQVEDAGVPSQECIGIQGGYCVFMRDSVPFENAQGLFPFKLEARP